MDCNKCERRTKTGTTETIFCGLTVIMPCVNCEDMPHITFTCDEFTQKKKLVDPDATCGDCGCYIEHGNTDWWCGKHEYQLPRGLNTVACVKIEPKETTAIPALGRDCPSFIATDHDDSGMCTTNDRATCHGDGESCEAARARGRQT